MISQAGHTTNKHVCLAIKATPSAFIAKRLSASSSYPQSAGLKGWQLLCKTGRLSHHANHFVFWSCGLAKIAGRKKTFRQARNETSRGPRLGTQWDASHAGTFIGLAVVNAISSRAPLAGEAMPRELVVGALLFRLKPSYIRKLIKSARLLS